MLTRKRTGDDLDGNKAAQELRAAAELRWQHRFVGRDYLMDEVRQVIDALPPDHALARALRAKAAERLHALTKEQWTQARKPPPRPPARADDAGADDDAAATKAHAKAHAAWLSMLGADRVRKRHVYKEYCVVLAAALAAAPAAAPAALAAQAPAAADAAARRARFQLLELEREQLALDQRRAELTVAVLRAEELAMDLAFDALERLLEEPAQAQQALPLVPLVPMVQQQVDEAAGAGLAVLSAAGVGVHPAVVARIGYA